MSTGQVGVSVMIRTADLQGMDRDQVRAYVQDLAEQATEELRRIAGGAEPVGPVSVRLDDTTEHALLGTIMPLHVAAPFDLDALPRDSEAFATYHQPPTQTGA